MITAELCEATECGRVADYIPPLACVSRDRFGIAVVMADSILAVVLGTASIALRPPGLDAKGNSQLGALALERLAAVAGWSVFEACHS